MGSRYFVALLAFVVSAEEISIGVFTLFRPASVQVREVTDGFVLEVPGRISRQFRGKLTMLRTSGSVTPVITMDVETAVAAAIAAEMPSDAPDETLKAMAVLVRSFYLSAKQRHAQYDFCDTTHCQFHREPPSGNHAASRATLATHGVVIAFRGKPFAPMYSASCGGSTMRAEDVGLRDDGYPYAAVSCPRPEPPWTRTLTVDDAGSLVQVKSEAARLAVVRKLGWSALPSNNYRVHRSGDDVIFTGRGQGHGVGLCQRGAITMAARGANFREILRHYLPDTELVNR
jgi:stage II sporulation protein D